MARKDVSTLRDEAAKAVERGRLKQAIELYGELEQRQPADPQWPKRVGEVQRRAGDAAAAVAAFERAAERYVQAGFLVQAIAVCKLILQIAPEHKATIDRLGELAGPPPAPRPPPAARPVAIAQGAGVDSVRLGDVMPDARRETLPGGRPSGKVVIPLGIEAAIAAAEPELEGDPPAAARPRRAADDLEARRALLTTPLLAGLAPAVLGRLITRLALVDLAAGEVLFREGEPGACLYVVSEGEVIVETAAAGELARLGPGAFFGEVALITDLPRSATIRAAGPVELLAIDRDVVRDLVAAHPEVLGRLLRFVRDRLVDRVTRTSELFTGFAPPERAELSARFELVEVEPGTVLKDAGERADGLYVVLAGRAEVRRDGHAVAALGPGEVFGEMSLLSGVGSATSVHAATKVLALRMPHRTFQEVIMTHPQVLEYVGELADRRSPKAAETGDFVDLHLDLL
jgi:CRP-like cAMP-binding protein